MTRTTIANLALREIGATRIDDFDEDSATGDIVRDVWEQGVRKALARAEWEFAKKVTERARTDAAADQGYAYSYGLPDDFIRLVSCYDSDRIENPMWDKDFERRGNAIFTDEEKLFIKYIYYYDTVGGWSPWFIDVLVADLASVMCSPLKSAGERDRLEGLATQRLRDGKSADGAQKPTVMLPSSRWIGAMKGARSYDRRYGGGWPW